MKKRVYCLRRRVRREEVRVVIGKFGLCLNKLTTLCTLARNAASACVNCKSFPEVDNES